MVGPTLPACQPALCLSLALGPHLLETAGWVVGCLHTSGFLAVGLLLLLPLLWGTHGWSW